MADEYWNDPVFQGMSPHDQLSYMTSQDPVVQKMSPQDQLGYLAHLRGVGPVQGPSVPNPPLVNQNPTAGLPGGSPGEVARPASDAEGKVAAGLLGAGALATYGPAAIPAIYQAGKEAVKALPQVAAAEGINYARQNLPGGKYIPPGAELLPFFMGGKKPAEGKAVPDRVPTMRPEGGPGDVPVPVGKVPMPGPRPNGPYSGPSTPSFMEPAQSGNIAKYGYHPESRTMVTEFKNGKVYQYSGVPKEVYDNFRNAESQGSFHAQNIKGRYTTRYRGSVSPTNSQ